MDRTNEVSRVARILSSEQDGAVSSDVTPDGVPNTAGGVDKVGCSMSGDTSVTRSKGRLTPPGSPNPDVGTRPNGTPNAGPPAGPTLATPDSPALGTETAGAG